MLPLRTTQGSRSMAGHYEPRVGQFLAKRALLSPDKVAVVFGDTRLTYAEMDARVNRIANALLELGVGRGDRVGLLGRNSAAHLELYFGLAKIGAVLVGVNWRLTTGEIDYILKDSGCRYLGFGPKSRTSIEPLRHRLDLDGWIALDGAANAEGDVSYHDLLASGKIHPPPVSVGADDPLLLMYTSGTTGRPKGAMLTHRQMFWASATVMYTLDHRPDDVNLMVMPMYHIGGMAMSTVYVHRGSTTVILPGWDAESVLEVIEEEKVNHFIAVPTMLHTLKEFPKIEGADLRSLRWILSAAAPLSGSIVNYFYERDVLVQQTYGLTEVAGPATVVGADDVLRKGDSAGLPFFHTEVRIVDDQGKPLEAGQVGEVQVRGPHVIEGYWQDPAATEAAFNADWFRTGDLARMDEEGYLFIVDRKKDMILSGGENIYPAEIERLLRDHPKIEDVAVLGIPDQKWGELVCAVVVVERGEALSLEEVAEFCDGRIARYKIPQRLECWHQDLPRNPTGKVLKNEIRERLTD